jgi:hypothetical protein
MMTVFAMAFTASAENNKAYFTDQSDNPVSALKLADGEETVIRVKAEVPEGKTLNAYTFLIMFGDNVEITKVKDAPGTPIAIMTQNIDKDSLTLKVNGFDLDGVTGGDYSFIDINLKGVKTDGKAQEIIVLSTAFGTDADNQFIPKSDSINVITY